MLIIAAGYHTLDLISTNDPRPRWDVSASPYSRMFEILPISERRLEQILNKTGAPHQTIRGYVKKNNSKKGRDSCPKGMTATFVRMAPELGVLGVEPPRRRGSEQHRASEGEAPPQKNLQKIVRTC